MADSHAYEAPLRVREFLLVSRLSTRLLALWFCIAITSGRDVAILLLGFLHYYFNFRERQSHARREGDRRWKHQSKLDNSGSAVFRQRGVSGVHLISIAKRHGGAIVCWANYCTRAAGFMALARDSTGSSPIVRRFLPRYRAYIFSQENYRAPEFLTFTWTPANTIR